MFLHFCKDSVSQVDGNMPVCGIIMNTRTMGNENTLSSYVAAGRAENGESFEVIKRKAARKYDGIGSTEREKDLYDQKWR